MFAYRLGKVSNSFQFGAETCSPIDFVSVLRSLKYASATLKPRVGPDHLPLVARRRRRSEDDQKPHGCAGASPCWLRTSPLCPLASRAPSVPSSSLRRAMSSADRGNAGLDLCRLGCVKGLLGLRLRVGIWVRGGCGVRGLHG